MGIYAEKRPSTADQIAIPKGTRFFDSSHDVGKVRSDLLHPNYVLNMF
jgi:hypothetical protein